MYYLPIAFPDGKTENSLYPENDMRNFELRIGNWKRSPRGVIFGVVTGLAEWRNLDPGKTRLIVFLIVLFTGVFPGIAIYFILALLLPLDDGTYEATWTEIDETEEK